MSLIKAMRMVEDFTDEMLEQAVRGVGNISVPSYVALSEMQRRANLRKSAEALQATPQGTVADRKIQEARGSMPQNVMNNNTEMSATMPRQGFNTAGQVPPFSLSKFLEDLQEDKKESKLEQFVDQYFANRESAPSLRRTEEQMDRRLDTEVLGSLASAFTKPTIAKAAESLAGDVSKVSSLRDTLETQDRLAAQAEVDRLDKEFATQLGAMEKVASADRAGDVLNLQTGMGLSNEAIEKAKQLNEADKNKILLAAQEAARKDRQTKMVYDSLTVMLNDARKRLQESVPGTEGRTSIENEIVQLYAAMSSLSGIDLSVLLETGASSPYTGDTDADKIKGILDIN